MHSNRKLTDNIFVNGEQRFFVASEVTDDLMEELKSELKSAVFITTEYSFDDVKDIIDSGQLPVLKYRQGDNVYDFHLSADYDDIQYEFRCISGDNDYVKTIELSENGWSEVSTRRLATHEALQSESRTREAADTALGERIESINDENPDWDELDRTSHAFIDNKPVRISDEEINALED